MLCLILIVGGLLIMMGQHTRSEPLFYYFRLEDEVPETHLLRLIEKHISFAFVRVKLKDSYSDAGRPSIDPELLLRLLLIGYLYGVTSESLVSSVITSRLALIRRRRLCSDHWSRTVVGNHGAIFQGRLNLSALISARRRELKSVLCSQCANNFCRDHLFVAAWQRDFERYGLTQY